MTDHAKAFAWLATLRASLRPAPLTVSRELPRWIDRHNPELYDEKGRVK